MSDVVYYETRGKRTTRVKEACFATIEYKGGKWGGKPVGLPDVIRYEAPIRGNLTAAHVRQYAQHLHGLFGARGFSLRISGDTAIWTIKPKGMTKHKALVRLSAFRYVTDLPNLVKQSLDARPKRTLSQWFAAFQSDHVADYKNSGESYWNAGHSLMIGIVDRNLGVRSFRARLKDKTIQGVEAHFDPESS